MKATFDREGLLAAFQIVSSVAPARSPKAILQNVKLVVGKDRAEVMATDLEVVGVRMEIRGVQVEQPGEALLPTARLTSILREVTDQEISIEAGKEASLLRGAQSEFELPGDDPAQYPEVPHFEGTNYHQVQANVLREMVGRTAFAAAQENARYALTGVLWELDEEKVRLVATDGRRLAVTQGLGVMHGNHKTGVQTPVVPTKAMSLLERNLTDPEEQVLVSIKPNEALFKTGRAVIYSRLVEGRYPPYKEVFPKKITAKIPLTVGPFQSAVRQAAIVTDEESKGVDFAFAKNKLTLKAHVADRGRAKVELPIEYEGKLIEIAFQPKFVTDMLHVLEPDASVTLELADANSAALFKAGDDYSYIVMPLTREARSA
jgi:DNA polymerase-3 subunit beta